MNAMTMTATATMKTNETMATVTTKMNATTNATMMMAMMKTNVTTNACVCAGENQRNGLFLEKPGKLFDSVLEKGNKRKILFT